MAFLLLNLSPTNACTCTSMWIGNGSVAMGTTKSIGGVTLGVNLRNALHAGDKAHRGWMNLYFEAQMSPEVQNRGSVAPQKGLMSSKHEKIPKTKDMCIFGNYNLH